MKRKPLKLLKDKVRSDFYDKIAVAVTGTLYVEEAEDVFGHIYRETDAWLWNEYENEVWSQVNDSIKDEVGGLRLGTSRTVNLPL